MRILFVDAIYPPEWLDEMYAKQPQVLAASLQEYTQWLRKEKLFFTSVFFPEFKRLGFECKEFISTDAVFLQKQNAQITASPYKKKNKKPTIKAVSKYLMELSLMRFYRFLKPTQQQKREVVLQKVLASFQPQIIFVREPTGIDTFFWNNVRDTALVVGLIGCNTSHPTKWFSHNFDVLFSITDEYKNFFSVQGIPSYKFSYGIEEGVYLDLQKITSKQYDISFVGLLGSTVQSRKTELMEKIASAFSFNWWGPSNVNAEDYPALHRTYKGRTSGMEMLKIYRQSKIVLNDYVDTAKGNAVNLRLYEVLTTGSFLLTRSAKNLAAHFPDNLLAMYDSVEECKQMLEWFLEHNNEREQKAKMATEYAIKHFSYTSQLADIAGIFKGCYKQKFKDRYEAGAID